MNFPRKSNNSNDDLATMLQQLGLLCTAQALDDLVARAMTQRWGPRQLLEQIARSETEDQAQRGLQRRLTQARLGRFKPLADFDWNWPKKIDRPLIEGALTLDFLVEGRNLVLIGSNGLGKTMIAKNIAHTAVLAGHSVLFRTAADLLADLDGDSPGLRRRKFRFYARPTLLCIDEVGYLTYDSHAANLLFEIIRLRYEHNATVLTTNNAFKEWNSVFPNATCIAALLDRLTHHADITLIEGTSYRVRESELEAEERKKRTYPKLMVLVDRQAVIELYLRPPDTPHRLSRYDLRLVNQLWERQVPLDTLEMALLLASARRSLRPQGAMPLAPVRSLHYFLPAIEELLSAPVPRGDLYLAYLRSKVTLRPVANQSSAAPR